MIAIIEFFVVGLVFGSLVKLSGKDNQPVKDQKNVCKRLNLKRICQYWEGFMISVGLMMVALAISYEIKEWEKEVRTLAFSAVILFCGFFIFTATFLRMTDKDSQ